MFKLYSTWEDTHEQLNLRFSGEQLAKLHDLADGLIRKIARENLLANWEQFPNEVIINSNYRYDWVDLVDFGYTDKCRLYTAWTGPLYFRVFRLNPVQDGTKWLP
jgi:hypothetical protein